MKVWIDLANSPHVHLFKPVVDTLTEKGHEVVISMRDFAQTVELAAQAGLDGPVIGDHESGSMAQRLATMGRRVRDLRRFARAQGAEAALSHNSYAQTLAGRSLGLPTVTMMDYEGTKANHIAFRAANVVVVPDPFPADALRRFGARPAKVRRYRGFKEQLYLDGFEPEPVDGQLEEACGAALADGWRSRPLVVVRPPATMAVYHQFENRLFPDLLRFLDRDDIQVVALPRTDDQRCLFEAMEHRPAIPDRAIDGPSLVSRADLVISGGGTMNREAAVLGTPACTIFAGELPAIDGELVRQGRLQVIDSVESITSIRLEPKRANDRLPGGEVLHVLLGALGL